MNECARKNLLMRGYNNSLVLILIIAYTSSSCVPPQQAQSGQATPPSVDDKAPSKPPSTPINQPATDDKAPPQPHATSSIAPTTIPATLPVKTRAPIANVVKVHYAIKRPTDKGLKLRSKFTKDELDFDNAWLEKKRELSSILVTDRQRAKRAQLVQEMEQLTNEQFSFLTQQAYFWSDLASQDTNILSEILSPEKLSIAAEAIANSLLIERDSNIPKTIEKLVTTLDPSDKKTLAKLKALTKAATISLLVAEAITKQVSLYAIKTGDKNGKEEVMALLNDAKALRQEFLTEQASKLKIASASRPDEKKKPSKWDTPHKPPPPVEEIQKIKVNIDAIKSEFLAWLDRKDYDIDPHDVDRYKKYLIAILKFYDAASDDGRENMRNAFVAMVAQHSVVNDVLSVLNSIDQSDIGRFMMLYPAEQMGLLWNWEKERIIAGESVRDVQKQRLARMFAELDERKLKESADIDKFWILIEDQPEAAAMGFASRHYRYLGEYLATRGQNRIANFANKVVSKINIDQAPAREMVDLIRALTPLGKINSEMERILLSKKIAFKLAHARDAQLDSWVKQFDQPF